MLSKANKALCSQVKEGTELQETAVVGTLKLKSSSSGSHARRSGAIMSYALTLSQVAINLIYVPLLLTGIGREEYGLYQLVGSLMAYIAVMNTMFAAGVTRYYCKALAEGLEVKANSVLSAAQQIYTVISIVVVIAGFVTSILFGKIYALSLTQRQIHESQLMLAVLVVNLIVTMYNTVSVAVITGKEKFAFLKGSQLIMTVLQPIGVIAIIREWPYALSIPCVHLILNILVASVQRGYARRVLGGIPKADTQVAELRGKLVKFSGGVILVLVSDMVFWRTNQLVLGYVSGVATVAVYGVAYQLYTAYSPLGTAVSSVFMPRISQLWHGSHDITSISELFSRVGRLSSYVLLLILGGFFTFGATFIQLWAGEAYTDAYVIALVLMACQFVDLSQNLGLTILQVTNHYAYRGKVYASMAVANVALILFMAPQYGGIGCAIVSGACLLMANGPVMNRYYNKVVGIDVRAFWKSILRVAIPLACFTALSSFVWSLVPEHLVSWFFMIVCMFIYFVAYVVVAYLFSMDEYEKQLMESLFSRLVGCLH